MPKEKIRERSMSKVKIPKKYKVLMYNDDFTTMDFVVEILIQIFNKTKEEAVQLMLQIDKSTYAVVGIYTRDIARTKASLATEWARREGFPLKVEAVEE